MELVRNPSPPPEILNNKDLVPDKIGDTLFSKKWIYTSLMSILEFCDKSCLSSQEDTTDSELKNDMVELDPKIEDNSCSLWDMSANESVAKFLDETGVPAMCLDIIEKTKSPRLLEIIIGIIGNMSSYDDVCQSISTNKNLVRAITSLSGTSDTPTLLQVFRVILCGILNENSKKMWYESFEENSYFMENIRFILKNNLNRSVLKRVFQILNYILVDDVKFCERWNEASTIEAMCDGGLQLMKRPDALNYFFVNLGILSQYQNSDEYFVEHIRKLNPILEKFILYMAREDLLASNSSLSALYLCYEVFDIILKSKHVKRELVLKNKKVLKTIYKCYERITEQIADVRKSLDDVDDEDSVSNQGKNEAESMETTSILIGNLRDLTDIARVILNVLKHILPFIENEEDRKMLEEIGGL